MNLFDTIHCDYPLPEPGFQKRTFQTKDLDCTLDRYRISTDGRLWRLSRRIDLFAKDNPAPETDRTRPETFFQRLESLDPEVAQQVLETFGNRDNAALWLGKASRQFDGRSPYEMLSRGERRKVLDALFRIDHGFFA